jgi:hypothetical protein
MEQKAHITIGKKRNYFNLHDFNFLVIFNFNFANFWPFSEKNITNKKKRKYSFTNSLFFLKHISKKLKINNSEKSPKNVKGCLIYHFNK